MNIYFYSIFFLVNILVQSTNGCELWCRKPMSFEYVCCDRKTPAFTPPALPTTTTAEPKTTTTEKVVTVASAPQPTSCRYYCVYGEDKVYCCDDGSGKIPLDHDSHKGRCPAKKEQLCKKGGIYLHINAAKMTTKKGGRLLSKLGKDDHHPPCASDGYCEENERCCENICAKKHTCLRSVYDYDGGKRTILKKKKSRRG